jgi:outer membrane protein OmpA-like peptidoglycan-associated protein
VTAAVVVAGLGSWSVVRVEHDLSGRSRSALAAAGLGVRVRMDGRDAVIEPGSGTRADLERAAAVVAALPGVRTVRIGGDAAAGRPVPPAQATPTPGSGVPAPELVIRFPSDDAGLGDAAKASLDELAERVLADPRLRVRVAGHADASGNGPSNLELSRQRADTVVDYLVAAGVPAERVTAEAYGDARPVAGNLTPRGRSLNRRVEVVLQEGS